MAVEELEDRWVPNSYVVNSTADTGSGSGLDGDLLYCITQANASGGANTITFDPTVFAAPQTITVSSVLDLTNKTGVQTITGPTAGVSVSGGGASGVFEVAALVRASISGLTIEDGNGGELGGGVDDLGNLTLTNCSVSYNYAEFGGGISTYPDGKVTLTNCTVTGNSALESGGAIYDGVGGTATVSGSTISNNSARFGAGVLTSFYGATLTMTNSTISGNYCSDLGGALYNGAASTATLTNCMVTGNYAVLGGGINNYGYTYGTVNRQGQLNLTNCTVSGNTSSTFGGGISNDGGAVKLTNSTVSGNTATTGGGIYNSGKPLNSYYPQITRVGTVTLTNCTVSGNTATNGGGLSNHGSYDSSATGGAVGTATVTNSTFYDNTAAQYGGGVDNYGGLATLTNCTISGNSAATGGGMYTRTGYGSQAGTATLINCTVSANSATTGGGGVGSDANSTVNIGNTIVAVNTGNTTSPDAVGTFSSLGNNLIGETDGSSGWGTSDLTGTIAQPLDPLLAPLGSYGGSTQTMPLLPGSPALDAGSNALIPTGTTTDQRGLPRIHNSTVDIGAFESSGFTISVTSGNDQSTALGTSFTDPLVITVTANNPIEPVAGGIVTFTLPSSGPSATITGGSGTIGANGTASVDLTANDTLGSYTVTATASGITNTASFSLTNTPGAATQFTVTAPSPVTAGTPFNFTVQALDAFGNDTTDYTGTVTFTSTDLLANLPANSTLTSGVGTFTATLETNGIQTITATDTTTPSITGTSGPIDVVSPTSTVVTTTSPSTVTYGTPVILTATVTDTTGGLPPNAGTVTFYDNGTFLGTATTITSTGSDYVTFMYTTTATQLQVNGGAANIISAVYTPGAGFLGSSSSGAGDVSETITPFDLTVSGVIANNKVYDSTTAATLNTTNAKLVGVFSGDTVTLKSSGATGTFASKDVANGITVTTSGFTLSGAEAGDYTLTQPSTTANITPFGLTVTGVTAANKVYDSTTAATLNTSNATLVGVFSGDTVMLGTSGAIGTFVSKDVANGITVTTSGFTLGGAQAGDYTVSQPSTTANITPFGLTITGITAQNKVYNSTTKATLNTANGALVGVFSGDTVTLVTSGATGTFASKDVANGITVTIAGLTLGGAQAEDYTVTQPTTTANITPFGLTVTGVTANNKIYDDSTAATLNTSSASLVGVFHGDSVSLNASGATGTFASKNVGTGIRVTISGLTLVGAQAGDYTVSQPITTANITAFGLSVTGVSANNKVYDSTTVATLNTANAKLAGTIFSGDMVTLSTISATGTFASKDVGNNITVTTSGFTLVGAGAGDYTLIQPTTSANITPFGLTATGVTAANKVYDSTTVATLNTGNAALVGVFSGDTVTLTTSGLTGTFASKDVGNGITVSISGLTLGGAQAGDYTLSQPTTTANITPFGLTTTGVIALNKVYDSTTTATLITGGTTLVGVFSGDTVTLATSNATGTFASKDVGNGITVSISGLTLGGAQAGDYTVSQPTTTADITPFGLTTAGVVAQNKVYNGTTVATLNTANAALLGVFSGDTVTLTTNGVTGTFASKDVGNGIPVATSGFTLVGAQAGDYTVSQPITTADITPFGLTTTGVAAQSRVYNGTTAATLNTANTTLVGVFPGDTVTLTTSSASGAFASKDVGNGITVLTSGFTLGGAQAGDYTVSQPTTTADITPFGLTVSGVIAENKVYDGTTAATLNTANATLVGVFPGDTVTLNTSGATGTFVSKNVTTGVTVTTSGFTLGGPQAGDYTVSQPTTSATITAYNLTVTGVTADNKVYDDTTRATLNTADAALAGSIMSGDSVTLVSSSATGTFANPTISNNVTVTTSGFTLSGPQASNYTLTQPTTTANIIPLLQPTPVLVSGQANGTVLVYPLGVEGYYGSAPITMQPFGAISADIRTAVGDVNGDGIPDYIFATGPGVPFEVTVISGATGNPVLVAPFDPFLPAPPLAQTDLFTAGGFVSAGDFMHNGRDQIVISPDQSGGPRVTIYDLDGAAAAAPQAYTAVGVNTQEMNPGSGLTRINNFFAVNSTFRGGARTATGDLNGDGVPDLAIAAGYGGGPAVQVINGTKVTTTNGFTASDDLVGDFFAFDSSLRDGAYLAIGDVLGTGQEDLILGPGAGGPAQVEILSGTELVNDGGAAALANPIANFVPTGLGPDGSGIRVAVAPIGIGDEVNVIVSSGRNMAAAAKVYPVTGFTNGSTSEPTGGQLLSPFGGAALTDGVFVG